MTWSIQKQQVRGHTADDNDYDMETRSKQSLASENWSCLDIVFFAKCINITSRTVSQNAQRMKNILTFRNYLFVADNVVHI